MNSDLLRWLFEVQAIPAGAEGVRLAWEHPLPPWLWTMAIIGAAAFAFWSYSRLTGGRAARWALAALRFVLIIIVLVLVSGPMLEQPRETVEQDWVLVLLDRSRSMQIADAEAPGPPRGAGADRISREAQLRGALGASAETWRTLAGQRHVVWLGFNDGAFNLQSAPAPDGDANAGADLPVELGDPGGEQTSLNTALEQALLQAAARPLSGIVLLSDGRTGDPPQRTLLRRLQAEAVPVFTVPLGSDEPIGDVAIRRIDAPRRAFVRDKVPVVIELDRLGGTGAEEAITVALIDTVSGEELATQRVEPGEDRITLTAEPDLAGQARWQVVVRAARSDLIPENNTRPFDIELIDRPLRVLYVEGYPRWEYRYLKNLLVRESSIESSVMLLSADRDFAQEGNQAITRLPRSPEEFASYDVIVLGDVPASFFAPEQLEMIRDQVAERGTGLLWIGGERSMPGSYAGTVLADLLPMRGSLQIPVAGAPVTVEPTRLAQSLGVLRLSLEEESGWPAELSDRDAGWSQLYWMQRIEPGRLKPTAEPLARTVQEFEGAPLPVVIFMRYGAGQTIYVASDEIWRWRYGRGEHLPEQFWIQMIRMLGRETLINAGDRLVLEAEPRRVAVGQPVHIDLRLLDAQLAEARRASVAAKVLGGAGDRPVAEVELRRVASGEERYAATWIARVPGSLRIRLDDPTMPGVHAEAAIEVIAPEDELRRPETDHELLRQIADATGGRVLEPQELGDLTEPGVLRNRSVRTINPLRERLWDSPLFFALVVGLATVEWLGRKAARLI